MAATGWVMCCHPAGRCHGHHRRRGRISGRLPASYCEEGCASSVCLCMPAVGSSTDCLLDTLFLQHCGHVTLPQPHAGGLKALVGDAEELRKAVEFGTACGAFVTQVCAVTCSHINATHADRLRADTANRMTVTCMLTNWCDPCRAPAQSSHSQQKPTSHSSLARTGTLRRPQQITLTCRLKVSPEVCGMRGCDRIGLRHCDALSRPCCDTPLDVLWVAPVAAVHICGAAVEQSAERYTCSNDGLSMYSVSVY